MDTDVATRYDHEMVLRKNWNTGSVLSSSYEHMGEVWRLKSPKQKRTSNTDPAQPRPKN